jgi:hypothetical protein
MRLDHSRLVALQLQLLQRRNMADSPDPIYITTRAEWEYLRPIITKLYMGDGWELSNVIEEIETKYHFKAT